METKIAIKSKSEQQRNDDPTYQQKKLYRNSLTLATLNEFEEIDNNGVGGPNRVLAVLVPLTAYIRPQPNVNYAPSQVESTMSNGVSITTLEDVGSLTSAQSLKAIDYYPSNAPVSTSLYSLNKSLSSIKNITSGVVEYEGVKFTGVPDSDCEELDNMSEEDNVIESTDSKIPDGGWGWMVVLAAFFINMAGDGIAFSFGLLYIEFLNEFQASKSKTAWIGSLFMAVPLLLGPVASAFVEKYGCRSMTIVGGIISGIGFVVSCFSTNIEQMYLTFGTLAGIGLALSYVTAVVSIAFWFEKKRGLACSLGSTGTGFGTTIYAPMTSYLIAEYGWRGTVLLLSGTFFNLCVCGAIMRDPEWWTLEQNKGKDLKSIKGASSCGSVSNVHSDSDMPDIEELKHMLETGVTPDFIENSDQNNQLVDSCRFTSVLDIPTYIKNNEKLPMEVIDKISKNTRLYNLVMDQYPKLLSGKTLSNESHYNTIQPNSNVAKEIKKNINHARYGNEQLNNTTDDNKKTVLQRNESFDESTNRNKVVSPDSNYTIYSSRKNSIIENPLVKKLETTFNIDNIETTISKQIKTPSNETPIKDNKTLYDDIVNSPDLNTNHDQLGNNVQPHHHHHNKLKELRKIQSMDDEPLITPVRSTNIESRCKSMTPPTSGGPLSNRQRSDSMPWLRRQFSIKEHPPTHYLQHLKVHRNSVMYRGATLTTPNYRLRASSCPNIYKNSITTIAKINEDEGWMAEARELFVGMFDFSMFLELHFLLVTVSTILLFTWFVIPYFYLTDFVTIKGLTKEEATSILSYIGVTNTIGMVALGWASDQPWLDVKKTYAICLVGCGISTAAMPLFAQNYWALLITCLCFGIFFASNFSCTPIILVELVPLDRFATAYGLTLLAQGIGNLVGPPLAGWVFDVTQIWDYSFYLAGFWIVISGVLIAIIPFTENRRLWGDGVLEKDREDCAV